MDEKILFFGNIINTVIIELIIMSQFIEERYKRSYRKKWLYNVAKGTVGGLVIAVNMLQIPMANVLIWIILIALLVGEFYHHDRKKQWMCVLEVEIVFVIFAICETLGYFVMELFVSVSDISCSVEIHKTILTTALSDLIIIFLWYVFILRIWKNERNIKYTVSQYFTHFVIAIYSIVNFMVLAYGFSDITTMRERYLLLINMLCIIFADMYFLYFIRCIAEKNQLQLEKELLEQQSEIQYKHYMMENEKYQQSMLVLHDIKKHLNMISKLQTETELGQARVYTDRIAGMLKKIVPEQYTNQPILNILLLEKKQQADNADIDFSVEVGDIDLSFMDTIDVTTIFGNILDNAFEAAMQTSKDRFVDVKIQPHNDYFIVIRVENSMKEAWVPVGRRPKTTKSGNHGYGLLNVEQSIKKYDGDIQYEAGENSFIVKIIINK